jgi:cyclopropane-fatty-acyl-phospholipid synthase
MATRLTGNRPGTSAAAPPRSGHHTPAGAPAGITVAELLQPMLEKVFAGAPPLEIAFWDGSRIGAGGTNTPTIRTPDALRRMMWAPGELGIARAFVAGDLEVTGNAAEVLRALQQGVPDDGRVALTVVPDIISASRELGVLGGPLAPPPEEIVTTTRGLRHSIRRDKQAVSHHYDVGNDFYRLVLGPSMTYSCARFVDDDTTLEEAQAAKHELICRKLGLADDVFRAESTGVRPRLLDVGCGWGSMAIHAATHHDVDVVGVTISEEQAAFARRRVTELGLGGRVEIRVQDYRTLADGRFDAISSVGMAEHVGHKRMSTYFDTLHRLLRPGGRLMNHAISSVGGSTLPSRSFVNRYVFPDGELLDVGLTVQRMEEAGFEVRDVENLREHYAITLRHWVANLERNWSDAVELVGANRARVWQLYMSGSVNGFDDAGIQLHQTLGVRLHDGGRSDMPRTRRSWD